MNLPAETRRDILAAYSTVQLYSGTKAHCLPIGLMSFFSPQNIINQ